MNCVEIINKKRENKILTKEELQFIFNGYLNGMVKDYQMSSLLMAICINGMSDEEIFNLVDIFVKSGDVLDLSMLNGVKVDKHSTGGVGDKVTLIVGPIVASCGVPVPKMSGRGLGHTGGTIDKLESIPGFNVNLTEEEMIDQVKNIGLAVTGQTKNLCPMDKVIYALRDVTGTVSSIPLIASSIMSKKIAGGADKILIDIKVGNGALLQTREDADKLSELMIKIGKVYHREVRTIISDMNVPLGRCIGNSLEVLEAIDVLKGQSDKTNFTDLCIELATEMVSMGKNISSEEANKQVLESLKNGLAYNKFLEMVEKQGGNINKIKVSKTEIGIKSPFTGTIKDINALELGKLSLALGAGKISKDEKIDYMVGIKLEKLVGDHVKKGDLLATLYVSNKKPEYKAEKIFTIK